MANNPTTINSLIHTICKTTHATSTSKNCPAEFNSKKPCTDY